MFLLKKVFELREKAHEDHEKPFLDHLEDLRVMVTRMVITLLVAMIACFGFQKQLMQVLRAPAENVLAVKQKETMPDGKHHANIVIPTVEEWNEAKKLENIASSLSTEQRAAFFDSLNDSKMEFHVRSVTLLRALKAIPEAKQKDFIKSVSGNDEMERQLIALSESNPEVEATAGANIRMMSALKPTETFMLSMKLAFFSGIVLAFPLLLMFLLQFVIPGLHEHEKKVMWPAMAIGLGLFIAGVLFAYFFVLPRALMFFYEWSADLGVSNDWRIGDYITFATQFTLLFGLSFELPVIVMVLVKLGIFGYETMAKTRSYAILAIFVAAAIITPTPDIMTLLLMALPMLALYEICIWLAWLQLRKEKKAEKEAFQEREEKYRQWLLQDSERVEANLTPKESDCEHEAEDGWHDDYEHPADHGQAEDEEWTQPHDAITGDEAMNKDLENGDNGERTKN